MEILVFLAVSMCGGIWEGSGGEDVVVVADRADVAGSFSTGNTCDIFRCH